MGKKGRENVQRCEGGSVIQGDATRLPLPPSDLISVNAGVVTPPLPWLKALRPRGRLIFPWRPSPATGLAIIVTRCAAGFSVKPLMASYFIPCVGAAEAEQCAKIPDNGEAWSAPSFL